MATSSRSTAPPKPVYRFSGRVLVKESQSAIPDLVVKFFDQDPGATAAPRKPIALSPALVDQLPSLGSVLTDQSGNFDFTLDADPSARARERALPDIVIVVLAPEDADHADEPLICATSARVLYMCREPRMSVGRSDARIIRIAQARLDQFGIPGYRPLSSMESIWESHEALKERLAPRLQRESEKASRFREAARQKVQDLTGIPRQRRNSKFWSTDLLITEKTKLAEDLPSMQERVVVTGLTQMAKSKNRPTLRLRLTPEDLKELNLKVDGGAVSGTVPHEQLAERIGGVDLVRKRGLRNPSPDELERRYLIVRSPDDNVEIG